MGADFIDFLRDNGLILCRYHEDVDQFAPASIPPEQLLAMWLDIDLDKVEAEKMLLLQSLRAPKIGREFEIVLPYQRVPLTKNGIRSMHHMVQYKLGEEIVQNTRLLARSAKIPHLERGEIELVWYPGSNRRQDADGIAPTLSCALDALVKEGVFTDDSGKYVLSTQQRCVIKSEDAYNRSSPRLVLIIRERLD